jgi:hypothetical protein
MEVHEREHAPPIWHRISAVALLLFILVGVLWTMDLASDGRRAAAEPPSPPGAAAPSPLHAGRPRALVLVIDSLRYETATDPAQMPYLAALRARAVWAKTVTTRDAVTVSALRAAFSGRERFSVFSVVQNFWRGDAGVESIFGQAAASGVAIGITSDGSFNQFGERVAAFSGDLGGEDAEPERQDRAARAALDDFVAGKRDLEVVHVTYGDHAAHDLGIAPPEYAAAFRRLDDLVRAMDSAVDARDTFVVLGDHGHTPEGRHGPGLDVPTLLLYRGPGFAAGLDLGLVAITEHRYFLSWALGLPLSPDYQSGRRPPALVAVRPLSAGYREAASPPPRASPNDADFPRPERSNVGWTAAYVGLLAWLWLLHVRRPEAERRASPAAHLALWGAAVPLAFPALRPWNAALGLALGTAWLLSFGPLWLRARRAAAVTGAAAVAAALALWGWAFLLAKARPLVHPIAAFSSVATLEKVWRCAAIAGVLVTLRWGPVIASWVVLGVTALLLYPTVYNYGSVSALAPVWSLWLLFLCVPEIRAWLGLRLRGGDRAEAARAGRRLLVTAAIGLAVFLILQPFFYTDATNFRFSKWVARMFPTPPWLPGAVVAKAIVFVRPQPLIEAWRSGRAKVASALAVVFASLAMVAFLSLVEAELVSLTTWRGLLAFGVTFALRRACLARFPEALSLHRALRLGLYWIAALYLLRLPSESRAWADDLFAALVLSAVYARRSSDPFVQKHSRVFLLMLGVIVSGWVTLAWTAHRLEWAVLYDWLPGDLVERRVAFFLPLILGRYAIPVLMAREILAEPFGAGHPARTALRLSGVKFFALAMMVLGIGCYSVASDVYLEAVEEQVIVFLLLLGLVIGLGDEVPRRPLPQLGPQAAAPEPGTTMSILARPFPGETSTLASTGLPPSGVTRTVKWPKPGR